MGRLYGYVETNLFKTNIRRLDMKGLMKIIGMILGILGLSAKATAKKKAKVKKIDNKVKEIKKEKVEVQRKKITVQKKKAAIKNSSEEKTCKETKCNYC